MHALKFLHKLFDKSIHEKRITLLAEMITAIVDTKQLSLTVVGRGMKTSIQERSAIRKVDRCLDNRYFQQDTLAIYQQIARRVIRTVHPELIVDWTKLPNVNRYALRASLSAHGRAITVYEEVHPQEKLQNRAIYTAFLKRLKLVLPTTCCPILVTDAGFYNSWFKLVKKQDWDYVGRVRGLTKYAENGRYKSCKSLHKLATETAQSLGEKNLSRSTPLSSYLYTIKQSLRGRKKRRKDGKICRHPDSKNHSRSHREPWLLASSLHGRHAAKKVIAIYKRRMTIEEAFRDLKSSQYGLSMENNRTQLHERLIVWLMLAALACLWAWMVGQAAEHAKLHSQFQANTIKIRRVLSFFYLGCQVIRKRLSLFIDFSTIIFSEPSYGGL